MFIRRFGYVCVYRDLDTRVYRDLDTRVYRDLDTCLEIWIRVCI